jgi:hypothetical protein
MPAGAVSRLSPRSRDEVRLALSLTIWSVISLVAAVLLSRRVAGAFRAETGAAVPCLASTAAVLVSLAAHAIWRTTATNPSLRKRTVAATLTLIPPLILGAALWTSPSAFIAGYFGALLGLSALATIVIGDFNSSAIPVTQLFTIARRQPSASSPITEQSAAGESHPDTPHASSSMMAASSADLSLEVDESDEDQGGEGDPSVLQWLTRRLLPDGAEAVEGSVRIHFGAGERFAVAHVSFNPPLSERPNAECQVLVDFDGRVRIGVARAYGLRIEARRAESTPRPVSVDVGFSANVRAAQSAAA